MAIERQVFDLAATFDYALPYSPYGLIIEAFTGEPETCYISRGAAGGPIASVALGRIFDYDEPMENLWVHNTLGQPGSRLIITFVTHNARGSLSLPARQNPLHLVSEALAVGLAVVNFAVHIVGLDIESLVTAPTTNTDNIYVGGSDVSAVNGHVLVAGDSIYFKVRDTSAIYCLGAAAAQEARLIVEAEA